MSNGESKIAESKAALCCGFAIALRALFLVIPIVIASIRWNAWQSTVYEARIMGILCLLIASGKPSQ